MEEILKVSNLCKHYGNIKAADNISFSVNKGEVLGILGPNGSGKTTTLSIVSGVIKKNQGNYIWFNQSFNKSLRHRIGSLIEIPTFYPYLTLYQNLKIITEIKNIPDKDINRVLGLTMLLARKYSKFEKLSLGLKQRLGIAAALLGDPEVLVLDEPANGLDPEGIADIRKIIKSESNNGKTIIMASHILDEVEKVCSHVVILKMGQVIAHGKVDELITEGDMIILSCDKLDSLYEEIVKSGMSRKIDKNEQELILFLKDNYTTGDLSKFVVKKGFILSKLETKKKSLESMFLELVK